MNLFIVILLEVYKLGRSYSTVNTYRSAISATIHSVTGRDLGSNHVVGRFMKGIYVAKPPLPRHTATWDVSKVTDYLRTLVPLESLSFKDLSNKLVMLLALSSSQRVQTLYNYKLSTLAICLSKRLRLYLPLFRDLRVKTSWPGHNSLRVMFQKYYKINQFALILIYYIILIEVRR